MNRRLSALLATGGAVALTLALSAPPTLATAIHSSFSASPGGAITATAGRVTLTDTKTGTPVTCTSSSASVMLPGDGIPHAGSGFGKITSLTFTGCTLGPTTFTVTNNAFPWSLNIASFNTVHDVVHGSITGISITLSGGACTALVDGTAAGAHNGFVKYTYSDEDKNLTILKTNGKLAIYDATGCGAIFANSDPMTIEGVYTVKPPQDIT